MDVHAKIESIREAHTRAIAAIEKGDAKEALADLTWVEAELVGLSEVSLEVGTVVQTLVSQQREALKLFQEGLGTESLGVIRLVLDGLGGLAEAIQRASGTSVN